MPVSLAPSGHAFLGSQPPSNAIDIIRPQPCSHPINFTVMNAKTAKTRAVQRLVGGGFSFSRACSRCLAATITLLPFDIRSSGGCPVAFALVSVG